MQIHVTIIFSMEIIKSIYNLYHMKIIIKRNLKKMAEDISNMRDIEVEEFEIS